MSVEQIPSQQKAWNVVRRGKPATALKLIDDASIPKLLKGQILIKVQAAALNAATYKAMGWLPKFMTKKNQGAEIDFAGVVVNSNESQFKNGDEVLGMLSPLDVIFGSEYGVLAQYARVPAQNAVLRPSNITPVEAAGLTAVGQTSYQALFDCAKLQPGQSVFVNGGSTSVGIIAIQLAKAIGCKVTASASGKNEAFVRSLGADEFIDYTKQPLHEYLISNPPEPKFHVIYDGIGSMDAKLFTECESYLAPDGIYLCIGVDIHSFDVMGFLKYTWKMRGTSSVIPCGTNRKVKVLNTMYKPEAQVKLMEFVADGRVKPVVDSVFPFEDALKAYDRIMTGRATGKVTVKVDPDVN